MPKCGLHKRMIPMNRDVMPRSTSVHAWYMPPLMECSGANSHTPGFRPWQSGPAGKATIIRRDGSSLRSVRS